MGNVDALKTLYTALGGEASAVADMNLISEVIVAIAGIVDGVGIELPKVTAADNGKVLKVANGKWAVGTDEIEA